MRSDTDPRLGPSAYAGVISRWGIHMTATIKKQSTESVFLSRACAAPQTLVIRDERIAGTLPAGYPQALPQLQVLSLSGLQLTGTLPAAWADWSSLRQLALYSNSVRRWPILPPRDCMCCALFPGSAACLCGRLQHFRTLRTHKRSTMQIAIVLRSAAL